MLADQFTAAVAAAKNTAATDQLAKLLWRAHAEGNELRAKVGDGVSQAADFISAASSIPSLNFTPSMTFGNWF